MGYKNPLLHLPAMERVMQLPLEQRLLLADILRDIRTQANEQAELAWKRRKAPIASYNRVVSTLARHIAHAITRDARRRRRC